MQRYSKIILNYPISSKMPLKSFLNVIEAYEKELELIVDNLAMCEPSTRKKMLARYVYTAFTKIVNSTG